MPRTLRALSTAARGPGPTPAAPTTASGDSWAGRGALGGARDEREAQQARANDGHGGGMHHAATRGLPAVRRRRFRQQPERSSGHHQGRRHHVVPASHQGRRGAAGGLSGHPSPRPRAPSRGPASRSRRIRRGVDVGVSTGAAAAGCSRVDQLGRAWEEAAARLRGRVVAVTAARQQECGSAPARRGRGPAVPTGHGVDRREVQSEVTFGSVTGCVASTGRRARPGTSMCGRRCRRPQ